MSSAFGELCANCALCSSVSSERDLIGDYERFHVLGEGAMGVVYLAKHVASDEVVALKLAKPELSEHPGGLRLFRRQAKLESALEHANIVHVHGVGTHEGRPFSIMPLMEGGTLAEPDNARRFAEPRARLSLVLEIARAVQFAHERGVLHCDLKPENILFDAEFRPHVSDFGLSRSIHGRDGEDAPQGGTRGWMSPEQVRGDELTTASDVFALGVLLHWLASAELPFGGGDDFERRVLTQPLGALRRWTPELGWGLEAIAHKALQKEPEQRYPSAAALVDDLVRVASEQAMRGYRIPFWGRTWHWAQRHPGPRNAIFLLLPCFALLTLALAAAQRAELRQAVLDMNAYAASGQAAAVLYQLRDYADTLEHAAADPAVRNLAHGPERQATPAGADVRGRCRTQTALEDPAPLEAYAAKFTTLLVLDAEGCPRARVSAEATPADYVRTGYDWRNYFSAAKTDAVHTPQVRKAYRSSISLQIKFALSKPLLEQGKWLGVVAGSIAAASTLALPRTGQRETKDQMTVLLGPFEGEGLRSHEPTQGAQEYTFLVHPKLGLGEKVTLETAAAALLARAFPPTPVARAFELGTAAPLERAQYVDPLLGNSWLAAFAPVGGTGYVVVVQTRDAVAIRPSNGLHRLGTMIAASFAVLLAAWSAFFGWRRRRERAR